MHNLELSYRSHGDESKRSPYEEAGQGIGQNVIEKRPAETVLRKETRFICAEVCEDGVKT